ncbi:MAG TPA: alpha-L-rhamnosidase C-terminal domain-containing protein [Prolixibacteraceae bacterium]|nr:alpha-L-rhamnosidase C-terminal domain-containing protein [Prolixibacteraceae bacterium]
MRTKITTFLLVLLTCVSTAQTNQLVPLQKINPELLTNHWKAQWITHPTESVLDYGVFHFRKSFDLGTIPSQFIIHVSADNRYRLFVNGKAVCFGPARGDLAHWYYESIDIAPFLQSGKNLLAAVVWNFGEEKPWAQFSLKTALIVQGNTSLEEIVNTGSGWKVIKNKAYQPASADAREALGQFIVVGPCDYLDASLYPWNWEKADYNDKDWSEPKLMDVGHPRGVGTDINWVLTPRRIPQMEIKDQRFASIRRTDGPSAPVGFLQGKTKWVIPVNQKLTVLIDQGSLTTAYPELTVSKGKGSRIKLIYAEALFDTNGNKGNRNEIEGKVIKGYADVFFPDGGADRIFRSLWFRTWKYLQLEIETKEEELVLNDFSSQFTAYPLEENAAFETDQADLTKIWNTGWHTARLCANETYYDCPYYEQLQYVGDTRIQALISLYVSGDDRLVRHALMSYDESRFHEGLTQSRYPSASPQVIPPFSLYWVDMVHDYWTLRDDAEFIKGFLPGIDQVLNWFTQRIDPKTGLLGKVEYWNFVDWADEWPWIQSNRIGGVPMGARDDGQSSIVTLQFAYAAQRAAELYDYYHQPTQAEKYRQLAQNLIKAVNAHCLDAQSGYIADTPEKSDFSMHAQIFGVLTDAFPEKEQKARIEKIIQDKKLIQPTLYFRFYLTQALKKTGMADHYLQTLGPWKDMLTVGLSTFAEKQDPTRSDCHAWSASPNYDFLATVAGIRPASPGFKTIGMEPALGELKFIKGQMPHPAGMIVFDLKRTGVQGLEGEVTLPEGLTGTFGWNGKKIELKGKTKIMLAQ